MRVDQYWSTVQNLRQLPPGFAGALAASAARGRVKPIDEAEAGRASLEPTWLAKDKNDL
jgi:hypothetical protein